MERIEDKKQRLANLYGIKNLSKGKHVPPLKRKDGTYANQRGTVSAPFVGDIALGKVIRISGLEDIVVLRWNTAEKHYNVIADDNAMDGNIVGFTLLYGEDSPESDGTAEA